MVSLITTVQRKIEASTAVPAVDIHTEKPGEPPWEAISAIVAILIPVITVCVMFGGIQTKLNFLADSIKEFKDKEKEKESNHKKAIEDLKHEMHSTENALLKKLDEYRSESEANQKEKREEFKDYLVLQMQALIAPLYQDIRTLKILHQRRDETLNDLKRKVKDIS